MRIELKIKRAARRSFIELTPPVSVLKKFILAFRHTSIIQSPYKLTNMRESHWIGLVGGRKQEVGRREQEAGSRMQEAGRHPQLETEKN